MSQPSKSSPGSSLGSLPKPPSAPPSPKTASELFGSNSTNSSTTTSTSTSNIDDTIRALQHQQQQSNSEVSQIKNMMMTLMNKLTIANNNDNSINSTSSNSNASTAIATATTTNVQPSIVSQRVNNSNIIHSASQQLFGLSEEKHAAIQNYSTNSNLNSNFNLNNTYHDDDVDTTIEIERKLNVSSTHSMPSFISALMPQPVSASQTSIVDLLQSGLKSAAANHENKIKSVEDFLKLLNEQAKHIIQNKGDVSDFLLYSLNLTKYLTEYGLQATLYYHFELLKKMQAGEIIQLHLDQPMIYINMTSRYTRLNQVNLLNSQKIGSMSTSNNKPAFKSNAARTSKFTGTPCPFHTKQLGKPANHSEADCRVKTGTASK